LISLFLWGRSGFDVGHEALRSMPRSQPPCKKAEKR